MFRRDFLKNTALATFASVALPAIVKAANPGQTLPPTLAPGATILFQGDSITDAGRSRDQYYPNQSGGMGNGYVYQIVSQILGKNPGKEFKCYNRGISGHKVFQLADRWEDDCLNLHPDLLSILIGVNDFWHTLTSNYTGTVETYDTDLRKLLTRTKEALPNIQLVMGEPFAVTGGTAINDKWEAFKDYQKSARQIATDFNAIFLPYQSIFDEALKVAPVKYWCPDGVHPSMAGGYLMAKAWVEGVSM